MKDEKSYEIETSEEINQIDGHFPSVSNGSDSATYDGLNESVSPPHEEINTLNSSYNSAMGIKNSNNTSVNSNNNLVKGQKSGDKNKKDLAQGVNKKENNNSNLKSKPNVNNGANQNNKHKNPAFDKKQNPTSQGNKTGNPALGNKPKALGSTGSGGASPLKKVAGEGIKKAWMVLPLQMKIAVVAAPLVIIIAIVVLVSIFSAITGGVVVSSMCSEPDYDSDNADATSFMCSMQNPVKGSYSVTSLYGWRNYSTDHMHGGVDLGGKTGTPIVAVHDGEVVMAQVYGGYGNMVYIKHGNFYTRYGHLSKISVSKGDKVEKGQKIGERGNTGNSEGPHLHFEISRENGKTVSPNPFFGYSDKGYERCLDPSKGHDKKCGIDVSGPTRKMEKGAFEQICGRTGNYTNGGGNSSCCDSENGVSGDILSFINKFEASNPKTCTTKNGVDGYKAQHLNNDGAVTAGYGVTNAAVKNEASQDIIKNSSSKNEFTIKNNKLVMVVGGCYNKKVIDDIQKKSIENSYAKAITTSANKYNVTFNKYEKDALTSFNYNLGIGYIDKLVKAYKNNEYKGLWNSMKDYIHSKGKTLDGLKKRRKAEFALFVTGDYTDKGLFYSRNLDNYNYYDSENVIARKATGDASVCDDITGSGDRASVIRIANQEYTSWHKNKNYCSNIKKYLASCGYNGGRGGLDNYCAGFVTYVLKKAGLKDVIGLPGYTCVVSNFKGSKNGKVRKAGGNYIPKPGDIMIVRSGNHVVLVEKVEGKRVHYIGGNEGGSGYCGYGKVNKGSYSLNDSYIKEYVTY